MAPYFSPRPWGGTRLRDTLGKAVPANETCGESWELSDHPDGPSRIADGPFAGMLFGDLVRAQPRAMIGRDQPPPRFPLLVKYIDAAEDLSVQVHPGDAYAAQHTNGDRGKTECWYVMDCKPDGEIILGLREGVTREELAAAITAGHAVDLLVRRPIQPGTFIYVPAGTVHAILAGTLICEIQQASNATYRFYDWDRQPKRELHIEHSLAVIDYANLQKPVVTRTLCENASTPRISPLVTNQYFNVLALALPPGQREEIICEACAIINVVKGNGCINNQKANVGDTFFLPSACPMVAFHAGDQHFTVLVSRSMEI